MTDAAAGSGCDPSMARMQRKGFSGRETADGSIVESVEPVRFDGPTRRKRLDRPALGALREG
jgi:hypothetical protein